MLKERERAAAADAERDLCALAFPVCEADFISLLASLGLRTIVAPVPRALLVEIESLSRAGTGGIAVLREVREERLLKGEEKWRNRRADLGLISGKEEIGVDCILANQSARCERLCYWRILES